MTKTSKKRLNTKKIINENRSVITTILSSLESMQRLNNLYWLRHEIAYTEPTKLFYPDHKGNSKNRLDRTAHFSFTCTKNLEEAYDYIVNSPKTEITEYEICRLHYMVCKGTYLEYEGGRYRNSSKVMEITVNGERYHAPDEYEIPGRMAQILYNLRNSHEDSLTKAFNIHYELIALQPFEDFNKRTARLVMNWVLIKNGYRPIIFNANADKLNYKNAIAAYLNGDRKAYMTYMTSCMVRTQKQIIKLLKMSRSI